jgi:ABC-type phosphate transport system substrate-binding protein
MTNEQGRGERRANGRSVVVRTAGVVLILGAVVLLAAATAGRAADAAATTIKVIAHPGVPGKTIPKSLLADIFLRRSVKWSDGNAIQPVDQVSSAPARVAFTRSVLGLSALDVQQYWVSQISKGKTPPPVKKTEEEVIAFVADTAGGIGYVAEGTTVPSTVRVLSID